MGNRKTRRDDSPDALGVGPVESMRTNTKEIFSLHSIIFFLATSGFFFLNTSKRKPGAHCERRDTGFFFFPFCSVFWNCPHLLVKAVSQESKQH